VNRRCLIFVHVPKSAGRTIEGAVLWRHRRNPDAVIRLDDLQPFDDIEQYPKEMRARAAAVLGHVPYGLHRYLPQECVYFTLLRQPVARVLASYRWIIHQPNEPLYARVRRDTAGLDEYVSTDIDKETVHNGQTRLVAGLTWEEEPDRAALETAKRNLNEFLVVGLTERFPESYLLLRKALGWRNPFYVTRNVSPAWTRRIEPSKDALRVIEERNQLDLELYAHATSLLEMAVARGGAAFRRELAAVEALNKVPNTVAGRAERALRAYARSPLGRSLGART
jgi:hypothetical protein